MSKKLNSGLFEDFSGEKVQMDVPSHASLAQPSGQGQLLSRSMDREMDRSAMAPPATPALRLESQRLSEDLNLIKTKMRGYESQIDVFRNQMTDIVRTIDQRFERISQALSRMEKTIHSQGRDTEEKIRGVREKMQSQNFEEAKIEGLIERQTVVIRNFENRLASMQKIINDKELLVMKYYEALKAAQQKK